MVDFTKLTQSNANATVKADKPVAEFWINIGYDMEVQDSDGVMQTIHIGLPMGIALDTMEVCTPKGKGQFAIDIAQLKNQLLAELQGFAKTIKSGEESEPLTDLTIRIRRVAKAATPTVGLVGRSLNFARK